MKTITNRSPQEFFVLSQPPLLIDVRSKFEYKIFHAPRAVNLSLPRLLLGQIPVLGKYLLPKWFRELPQDTPIAVICLTSHRSSIAAETLAKAGFTQVWNISGGMMEWRKLGLTTTNQSN